MRKKYAQYIPSGVLDVEGPMFFKLVKDGLPDFLKGEFEDFDGDFELLGVEDAQDKIIARFKYATVTVAFTNYIQATVDFDSELELRSVEQFLGTKSRHYDVSDVANTYRSLYDFISEYVSMAISQIIAKDDIENSGFVDDVPDEVYSYLDSQDDDVIDFQQAQIDEAAQYYTGDKNDLEGVDNTNFYASYRQNLAKAKAEVKKQADDKPFDDVAEEKDAAKYEIPEDYVDELAFDDVAETESKDEGTKDVESDDEVEWIEKPSNSTNPDNNEWDMLDAKLAQAVNPKAQKQAPYTKKPGKNQGKKPHLEAKTLEGNKKKKKKH